MSELPAVGVLELGSVARGIVVADAMVKAAPVDHLRVGTVQPGKYLVLVAGDTASVEEALGVGVGVAGADLLDEVFLPDVHAEVVGALVDRSHRAVPEPEALGIVEATGIPATVVAADAGVKASGAQVAALELGDGLGGKGYVLFGGPVADVEVAVEAGAARAGAARLVRVELVAQLHPEVRRNLGVDLRFSRRIETWGSEET